MCKVLQLPQRVALIDPTANGRTECCLRIQILQVSTSPSASKSNENTAGDNFGQTLTGAFLGGSREETSGAWDHFGGLWFRFTLAKPSSLQQSSLSRPPVTSVKPGLLKPRENTSCSLQQRQTRWGKVSWLQQGLACLGKEQFAGVKQGRLAQAKYVRSIKARLTPAKADSLGRTAVRWSKVRLAWANSLLRSPARSGQVQFALAKAGSLGRSQFAPARPGSLLRRQTHSGEVQFALAKPGSLRRNQFAPAKSSSLGRSAVPSSEGRLARTKSVCSCKAWLALAKCSSLEQSQTCFGEASSLQRSLARSSEVQFALAKPGSLGRNQFAPAKPSSLGPSAVRSSEGRLARTKSQSQARWDEISSLLQSQACLGEVQFPLETPDLLGQIHRSKVRLAWAKPVRFSEVWLAPAKCSLLLPSPARSGNLLFTAAKLGVQMQSQSREFVAVSLLPPELAVSQVCSLASLLSRALRMLQPIAEPNLTFRDWKALSTLQPASDPKCPRRDW
ncbi:hypothetical protein BT69DRAFT_1324630 [Atractiella rhizophila]|nr:hypothetical protein BT69DRAFT_1324630 [Atractiella rhizophila]